MNREVTLRPGARRDLRQIWRYTAERWDARQADTYVRRLTSLIDGLHANAARSISSDTLYPGLRRLKSGSHLVFFLIDEDSLDVVRILHEQMDFAANLAKDLTSDD